MLVIGGDLISNRSTDFHGTMYKTLGSSLFPVISVPSICNLCCAFTFAIPEIAKIRKKGSESFLIFYPCELEVPLLRRRSMSVIHPLTCEFSVLVSAWYFW